MVFANVVIEGWTIHPYVYCFFNCSNEVLILPPHNTEIFNGGTMTCGVVMVTYWGGDFQVFPEPLTKCSWWLPYVFIITIHPVAFKSVDDATLLCDMVFIFESHQEAFDGVSSFVMYLYPMFVVHILHAFTEPSYWSWCKYSVHSVQKRHGPITMTLFTGESDLVINGVDVLYEVFFLCFLNDHKCVIHKSSPQARGCGAVLIAFVSNVQKTRVRTIHSPSYLSVLPHFQRLPARCVGEITFNTQNQRYEFTDKSNAKIDLSFVMYHDNHYKCYIYGYKQTKVSNFYLFLGAKFILCKERHLHIPSCSISKCEEKNPQLKCQVGISPGMHSSCDSHEHEMHASTEISEHKGIRKSES